MTESTNLEQSLSRLELFVVVIAMKISDPALTTCEPSVPEIISSGPPMDRVNGWVCAEATNAQLMTSSAVWMIFTVLLSHSQRDLGHTPVDNASRPDRHRDDIRFHDALGWVSPVHRPKDLNPLLSG